MPPKATQNSWDWKAESERWKREAEAAERQLEELWAAATVTVERWEQLCKEDTAANHEAMLDAVRDLSGALGTGQEGYRLGPNHTMADVLKVQDDLLSSEGSGQVSEVEDATD